MMLVCMCLLYVCFSALISKTTHPNFTKFLLCTFTAKRLRSALIAGALAAVTFANDCVVRGEVCYPRLTALLVLYRHDVQINIMFVGGPNERLDYHLEHGEEVCVYTPRLVKSNYGRPM